MVRLFGNIMSHELVVAVILALAGLLVPIPIMALGVLIGLVQAYIFTVLAIVYLSAAVGSVETA
jgi:F-type H+-transporting ATPase subunit a